MVTAFSKLQQNKMLSAKTAVNFKAQIDGETEKHLCAVYSILMTSCIAENAR